MHWITRPGTSHPEERRIVTAGQPRAAPDPRACANFGSHIGQAFLAEEIAGVELRRELGQHRPRRRLRQDARGARGRRRRAPRALPRRADLPARAHRRGAGRRGGADRGARLRPGPRRPCGARPTGSRSAVGHRRPRRPARRPRRPTCREIEVRENLARARSATGSSRATCAGRPRCWCPARRSATSSAAARAYDVHVWSTPETRHSLTDIRNLPIDTPGGGRVRLGDVAEVRIRPTPNVIHREDASRRIDVAANVEGRDLGSVVARRRDGSRRVDFPLGYHAELLGEAAERQGAQSRLLLVRRSPPAIAILLLLQAAFRELAPGGAASSSPCRWRWSAACWRPT